MKILCMADPNGVKVEAFKNAAKLYFGEAEVAVEELEVKETDLHIIEKHGPGAIPIPKGFFNNHEDVEIILGGILCPFSREILNMFPKLRVIGTCRGGLENLDMEAVKERGIAVVNGYGRNAEAVSDFTMALMLSELRNVARSHKALATGVTAWEKNYVNQEYIPHMKEATVGLFGFGYIGKLVAQKVAGFGSRILIYDPYADAKEIADLGYTLVDKDTIFRESDILSVHARLVDATRGIIGREDIDKMKSTAFFINTARAGLVDYDALYDALVEKRIGGAGLDVWPVEPIPADSPWRSLDNCTMTQHMAGGVRAARPFAAKVVAENVVNALKGIDARQIITKDAVATEDFRAWADGALEEMKL